MRKAIGISAGAHVLLIAVSLLRIDWFDREDDEVFNVAEVTILTESQFEAAISRAPQVVPTEVLDAIAAPSFEDFNAARPDAEMDVTINDLDGPDDPSEADAEADLTAVLVRNQVEVDDEVTTLAPELPGTFDTALNTPSSVPTERRPQTMARPGGFTSPRPQAPSLRIDTTPAAPPPEDAETADDRQDEIALSTDANTDQPPQEATAPEEAATEVVPEIADDLPEPEPDAGPLDEEPLEDTQVAETGAPLVSVRPRARPEVREPERDETPVAATQEPETPVAEQPASEQPAEEPAPRVAEASSDNVPAGPPLGTAPIDAVKRGMASHWSINFQGAPNWETFVVTMRFELSRDGQLLGDPVPIVPQRVDGGFAVAARDARSAIIRAARAGVFASLPPESYGRWQTIEMTFDPGRQSIGFGS